MSTRQPHRPRRAIGDPPLQALYVRLPPPLHAWLRGWATRHQRSLNHAIELILAERAERDDGVE